MTDAPSEVKDTALAPAALLAELAAENAVVALESGAERDGIASLSLNRDERVYAVRLGDGSIQFCLTDQRPNKWLDAIKVPGSKAMGGMALTRAEAVALIAAYKMAVTSE